MAASGVYTLSKTLNETLTEAFDVLQILSDGEPSNGDIFGRGKISLNLMLKEWQAQGLHLWTYEEGTLFLKVGQAKYDFRLASTHLANTWFETTTAADTVASTTSITVASASDINNNDVIGIIQNDNDLFWTT
ncbi:MAG: hypothetical protein KAJ19_18445, partial [Gammaproteobacteria bacterium]|nr:hypothetical protein [Gammaproteobacteria bacterium]